MIHFYVIFERCVNKEARELEKNFWQSKWEQDKECNQRNLDFMLRFLTFFVIYLPLNGKKHYAFIFMFIEYIIFDSDNDKIDTGLCLIFHFDLMNLFILVSNYWLMCVFFSFSTACEWHNQLLYICCLISDRKTID